MLSWLCSDLLPKDGRQVVILHLNSLHFPSRFTEGSLTNQPLHSWTQTSPQEASEVEELAPTLWVGVPQVTLNSVRLGEGTSGKSALYEWRMFLHQQALPCSHWGKVINGSLVSKQSWGIRNTPREWGQGSEGRVVRCVFCLFVFDGEDFT